eukprot:2215866-Prymnesium_polylepis.1
MGREGGAGVWCAARTDMTDWGSRRVETLQIMVRARRIPKTSLVQPSASRAPPEFRGRDAEMERLLWLRGHIDTDDARIGPIRYFPKGIL